MSQILCDTWSHTRDIAEQSTRSNEVIPHGSEILIFWFRFDFRLRSAFQSELHHRQFQRVSNFGAHVASRKALRQRSDTEDDVRTESFAPSFQSVGWRGRRLHHSSSLRAAGVSKPARRTKGQSVSQSVSHCSYHPHSLHRVNDYRAAPRFCSTTQNCNFIPTKGPNTARSCAILCDPT